MIAVAAVFAIAVLALAMMPTAAADDDDTFNTFSDIRAESYMTGVGKNLEYKIFAGGDFTGEVSFTAKITDMNGNSVSRVSPSSGYRIDPDGTTLTATAPSDPGMYLVVVEFIFTDSGSETKTVTRSAPLRAIVPVTLSATLVNNSGTVADMKVWFVVDGNAIEESEQNIRIEANSTKAVTHEWVVEMLSGGRHTVELAGEVGPIREAVEGLDTPVDFFVGQTSYALTEALLVIVTIVMLIILIIVFRKPVKNVGKPKGRR
jgi:hypothetical protein